MSDRKKTGETYFFIELYAYKATVLQARECTFSYPSFAGARMAAGNYFHTLEEAQRFADSLNRVLQDRRHAKAGSHICGGLWDEFTAPLTKTKERGQK